ncbi:DUF6916 family protein [uncultured Desulfobacter sp.]|uniref:DUF6916 family protein n=1 Tax=uncultured Desulfobacter sp. TaxID=240139 RepID=UPI002AAC457D|nr:hypothetical protein [uncultured Desulfobacter sp.]
MENPNEKFNAENLKPLLGDMFKISDASGNSGEIKLSKLNEGVVKGIECDSFAALFTGPENQICEQGIYRVAHDAIGSFDLMVSPKSPKECEIIISRLTGDAVKLIEK